MSTGLRILCDVDNGVKENNEDGGDDHPIVCHRGEVPVFISTKGALRRPMTYDNHPSQSHT